MTRQTITTEIDVPEGYEFVRIGMTCGLHEVFVQPDGHDHRLSHGYPRAIFRKSWKWPEWLTAPWIACDCNFHWMGFSEEPVQFDVSADGTAVPRDSVGNRGCYIPFLIVDFTPPPCDDWRESKRKNPNIHAESEVTDERKETTR